jgi:WhiB family redox-sensing transcriptional regulator
MMAGALVLARRQTTTRMDWRNRAACLGMDTNLWFPNELADDPKTPRARAVCAVCPVWRECLTYALENPKICAGIWGGLLERERKNLERAAVRSPDQLARSRARAFLRSVSSF